MTRITIPSANTPIMVGNILENDDDIFKDYFRKKTYSNPEYDMESPVDPFENESWEVGSEDDESCDEL